MKIIKNIEEYFNSENVSNTSVSLITLDKSISAEGKRGEGHSYLFYELIKLLFKYYIDCGEYNFINIRYVKNNLAVVVIPAFITYFQLEELNKINRILKNANLEINSYVNSFNPITKRKDMKDCYFDFSKGNGNNSLDLAIEFLIKNNRVLEYKLDFEGEKYL